ncbi:ATP-binding protein [Metallosphaera tengchongensis]|uniref:ATP-binding protein n=1 Tax=Metallosphaera tengchongensis TaxID=1532350 RepID=A0A6N0NZC9_9CREN|nr:ATP-binding protein [Metallosphaera tengchongensis]QKR00718.1 ATP-binding protein [Metallosphaera tengchongensis]
MSLEDMIEGAKERARQNGEVVGLISRVTPISHGYEEKEVRAEVPYEVYLQRRFLVGSYLGISLPVAGTLMLSRVKTVERADILAVSKVPVLSPTEDSSGLTTPLTLTLELLSEMKDEEVVQPSSPVDPQSPIFVPKAEFLKTMLGLPDEGIGIGYVMEGYRKLDVELRLTEEVLRHHVLVVGTTGAGKTNLLKTMIKKSKTPLMVFDIQGDYVRMIAKEGGTVVIPVPRKYSQSVVKFVWEFLRRSNLPDHEIKKVDGNLLELGSGQGSFRVVLMGFEFSKTYKIFAEVSPFFSPQGRQFFKIITEGCEPPIDNWEEECSGIMEDISPHKFTKENILRSVFLLRESGIIDVKMKGNNEITLGEPEYEDLLSQKSVLDLRWATEVSTSSATMSAFVVVDRIFQIVDKRYREQGVSTPYLLVFDEAHEYFPQGGKEEGEKESLERLINRVLRLGRVRGLGTVLATHRPTDLNDLILTLTNSKIALRADQEALKRIDMEEYSKMLQASPAGYGILRTFSLKVNDLVFRSDKVES